VIGSVFSYAIPNAGWWGFAALNEASCTLKDPTGKGKPIEIGTVYWVRNRDMKQGPGIKSRMETGGLLHV
jgi:cobalt/nickel transport protein